MHVEADEDKALVEGRGGGVIWTAPNGGGNRFLEIETPPEQAPWLYGPVN